MPDIDLIQLGKLTRRELKELEEKRKTPIQKVFEVIIMLLPIVWGSCAFRISNASRFN